MRISLLSNSAVFISAILSCGIASGDSYVYRSGNFSGSSSGIRFENSSDSTSGYAIPEATNRTRSGANSEIQRQGVAIGYVYGYFNYSEEGMKDTGSLHGMQFNFERFFENTGFKMRLESNAMLGVLKYDGALINIKTGKSTPHSTSSFDYILNLRGLAVRPIEVTSASELSPFLGVAMRYLDDNMDGVGSYEREVTYLYLPVGVTYKISVNNLWSIGMTTEYDHFLAGTVKSHVTQIGRASDLLNHQAVGTGYRASIDVTGTVHKRYDLHFGPYYQHWHVQDSDFQRADEGFGGHEPENKTDLIGINLTVGI